MEIFGIPVFIIFVFVIYIWQSYTQEQEKQKEDTNRKLKAIIEEISQAWDAIIIGMSIEDVIERLGKPIRVVKMGVQEAWGYGPDSSYGEIAFVDGRVVGYQKPSCTMYVSAEQAAETDTADASDGQFSETSQKKG